MKGFARYICRGCFKSCETSKKYQAFFCSKECVSKRKNTSKRGCKEHREYIPKLVLFHDGTSHMKLVCVDCGKGRSKNAYIPRDETLRAIHELETEMSIPT